MASMPRTEREARARTKRKLKALDRRARELLYECAAYWDEGQVGSDIDRLLEDLERGIEAINESMDEQIRYHAEVAELEAD